MAATTGKRSILDIDLLHYPLYNGISKFSSTLQGIFALNLLNSFLFADQESFGAAIEPSNVGAFSKNIGLARSADNYGGQIVSRIQF